MATSSKTMRCAGAMLLAATMAAVVCAQVDSAHNPVAEQASSSKNGIHIASDRVASFMWVLDDALGYRWDICSDGTIFDGTDDAYDSGMQLLVNGSSFPDSAGGTLSADSTEVEIGPWNHAGLKISRRVFINAKAGYCRWIDIFENEAAVEVNAKLQYCANMGADTHRTYTTSGGAQLTPKDWGAVTAGPSGNSSGVMAPPVAGM